MNALALTETNIQFCNPFNRSTWLRFSPNGVACQLSETTAFYCAERYPNCSTSAPLPAAPFEDEVPFEAPSEPSNPPSGCLLSTKPTPGDFKCVDGVWTLVASVDVPKLIIPSGSGNTVTVVIGNVSSTEIAFTGLGNTLEIRGCAANLSSIVVTLQLDDLNLIGNSKLRQVLLSLDGSGSGCTKLSNVVVISEVSGSTCKRVSTETSTQGTQLVALFSVSSTDCNGKSKTWWIVLVAVLCSVVLIATVALVLVFTLNSKARHWIRPYSKKRAESAL